MNPDDYALTGSPMLMIIIRIYVSHDRKDVA